MGAESVIEWTDSTLNFWRGCTKVGPGCAACYMFRDQLRYGRDPEVVVRCGDGTFFAPLRSRKWIETRERCIRERGRHFVFTCSWSDFFHEAADEWRAEAWDVIRRTPRSTYQILTKRPERIPACLPEDWGDGWENVWMGVTIENRRFVGRADLLRAVPAAVRFVSAEPLLGPLICDAVYSDGPGWSDPNLGEFDGPGLDLTSIDWLIAGGESGGRPGRRLIGPDNRPLPEKERWILDLRNACLNTGVPCPRCQGRAGRRLMGYFGESGDEMLYCVACGFDGRTGGTRFLFKQWGGGTPTSGGRLLDGRTWDEMPASRLLVPEPEALRVGAQGQLLPQSFEDVCPPART